MKTYFKAAVFLYILISNTISKTIYNTKTAAVDENSINLNNFMNLLHNAQIDLKWIRDTNQLYRGKSSVSSWLATPDLNYISLGGDSQISTGDKWYKQFRDDELSMEGKATDISATPTAQQPDESNKEKLVETQNLQDQSETTKNDLSHEADYKLSKFEQEREEKLRVDKENAMKVLSIPTDVGFLNKRKIDPDEEIRLKIRGRMDDKYETFSERHMEPANFTTGMDYDDYMKSHRPVPNYNLFKRETPAGEFTNRKLLAYYDYEESNSDADESSYIHNDRVKYNAHRRKRQKNNLHINTELLVNDMVTGVLPNILVKAIFTLAQKNNNFCKIVVPNVKVESFVEIKKSDIKAENAKSSDNLSKKTDAMINQIVTKISELVDNQVKLRACTQIQPDLKKFVAKLLEVRERSKISSTKFEFPIFSKQPELNLANEDDSNRFARSLPYSIVDNGQINDKYSIITNLQNSFSKLTTTDQIQYNPMKEFIDKHLSLLDELSELSRRNIQPQGEAVQPADDEQHQTVKRDAFADSEGGDEFSPDLNTIEIKQPYNDQMTERFIKLSKMVEFMRQNSLLDATDYDLIGNDFIL